MKLRLMICAMAAGSALFATDPTTSSVVYGVMGVADTSSSNTVVGVPWVGGNAEAITLSNLVSTATLATGDIIYLYEGETWYGYRLNAGVWEPYTTVTGTGNTTVQTPDAADVKPLAQGKGLIVQRASNTNPIYLCGRYEVATGLNTQIPAGKMMLIANPSTVAKTIGNGVGSDGDEIRVPLNGGGLKVYSKKAGAWGTVVETTTTLPGIPVPIKTQTWTATLCELAPGMGAWYVSKDTAVSIAW